MELAPFIQWVTTRFREVPIFPPSRIYCAAPAAIRFHLPGREGTAAIRLLPLVFALTFFLTAATPDDAQYAIQRERMVSTQIVARGVADPAVLRAMRTVKRHLFVPEASRGAAYEDHPLSIGYGQTISQPYIVAYMTEAIRPKKDLRVLEIGTGSGYQAGVLAEIVRKVSTIELIPELGAAARERLRTLGYGNVEVRIGDGYKGWPEEAPFDAIVVTAGAESIPSLLVNQLRDGGRMVIPVGSSFSVQMLVLVEKRGETISTRQLIPVRFVPFRRDP
jgi:protein-L-isoaspartate(D-aspartate) O-methyltransferase